MAFSLPAWWPTAAACAPAAERATGKAAAAQAGAASVALLPQGAEVNRQWPRIANQRHTSSASRHADYCSRNMPIELVLNVLLARAALLLRRGLFEGTNRVMDNFGAQDVKHFANEGSQRRPALCCHQIAIAKRVGRPDLDKRGSGQSDLRFTSKQTGDVFAFDHLRNGDEDLDPWRMEAIGLPSRWNSRTISCTRGKVRMYSGPRPPAISTAS